MTIQWFPGHMAKARRKVVEKLKLVDMVIELLDARLPLSSRNPMIGEIVKGKPRLVLLNKSDLADPEMTNQWIQFFQKEGADAIPVDAQSGKGVNQISSRCEKLVESMLQKRKAKGLEKRAVRTMILGIPNVGKSSLINRLAARKAAKTGDRPAVTKSEQWVKVGKSLELLDTPGILWPKFEDKMVGYRLAASGAIKDEIIDFVDVAMFLVAYLQFQYPDRLRERYRLEEIPQDRVQLLEEIGRKRGCIVRGGTVDYDKTAELLLREFRAGRLGGITLEQPNVPFIYKPLSSGH